jgi:hypothetical protein
MSTPTDDDRSPRARALFNAQVEALDGATATALRARRRDALAAARTPRRSPWWWPASGVATAALVMALWLPRGDVSDPAAPRTAPSTPAVTSAPANAERTPSDERALSDEARADEATRFVDGAFAELENDADFYAWLATVPADDTDTPALPEQGLQEGWTL